MAPKFNLTGKIKMSDTKINRFLGTKVAKKAKFMNEELDIHKLSVAQVIVIQETAKALNDSDEFGNLRLLSLVIQLGAPELKDLTESELNEFPVDELTKLSNEIMKYSGLVSPQQPAK